MKFKINEDKYFSTSADSFSYFIENSGNTIFRGKAFKDPNEANIYINISKLFRDYLDNTLPDYRTYTDSAISQTEAFQEFKLYTYSAVTESGETIETVPVLIETYQVLYDWDYDMIWSGQSCTLSNPVNGRADSRMKLMYSVYRDTTGETICYIEDIPVPEFDNSTILYKTISGNKVIANGEGETPSSINKIGISTNDYDLWISSNTYYDGWGRIKVYGLGESNDEIGNIYDIFPLNSDVILIAVPNSTIRLYGTFANNTVLEKISMPSTVQVLGSVNTTGLLKDTPLTNIYLPENLMSLNGYTFSGSALNSLYIPDSVSSIYCNVIAGTNITYFRLPENPNYNILSFNDLGEVETFTIPSNVTTFTFINNCRKLKRIDIPDTVTTIDWLGDGYGRVMYNNPELEEVIFHRNYTPSVTKGNSYAISNTQNLKRIVIPEHSFFDLGYSLGAWENYEGYTVETRIPLARKFTINDTDSIYYYAASAITTISTTPYVSKKTFKNGYGWLKANSEITELRSIGNKDKIHHIILPNTITSLDNYAFSECSAYTIDIGSGVTSIGSDCFSECKYLLKIDIPKTLSSLGSYAFENCIRLSTINYSGTISEWNSISKGINWNYGIPATVVHCSNGDTPI